MTSPEDFEALLTQTLLSWNFEEGTLDDDVAFFLDAAGGDRDVARRLGEACLREHRLSGGDLLAVRIMRQP